LSTNKQTTGEQISGVIEDEKDIGKQDRKEIGNQRNEGERQGD
jgi:hypothetical protein